MQKTLKLIVFSPTALAEYGEAIKQEVEEVARGAGRQIAVTLWNDGKTFFHPDNYPLNECIRNLHSFDGAIIILGPDRHPWAGSVLRPDVPPLPIDMKRMQALRLPVALNVLIEIGACMARFGRKRVFLLEPRSGVVRLPTYFWKHNAIRFFYEDKEAPGRAAVAEAAASIVQELGSLGQSAYYSDLPAFGLAHGYFTNFVRRTIERVEQGDLVEIGGEERPFTSAAFIVVMPQDRIVTGREGNGHLKSIGLVDGTVRVTDGSRDIKLLTLPRCKDGDTLYIVEVPGNLVPALDAIENIEQLWIDDGVRTHDLQDTILGFRSLLVQREIAAFFRYLDLLRENAKLDTGKLRQVVVPSLSEVTLDLIERHAA